jgi:hypothetical protein
MSRKQDNIERGKDLIREGQRVTVSEGAEILDVIQPENFSLQQMKRTAVKNCSLAPRQCSSSMLRTQLYRHSETLSQRLRHIHLTVRTSRRATFMSSVHYKRCYVVASLTAIKSYTHGFGNKLKPSPMQSGSL